MKNNTAPKMTVGQMKELIAAIVESIPANLPFGVAQYWIGRKGELGIGVGELLRSIGDIEVKKILAALAVWQKFYFEFFGIKTNFEKIKIPVVMTGFDRLIVVAQGLPLNEVYGKCTERFQCSCYKDDLNKTIIRNDRNPDKGPYAVWVRDRVEADEEVINFSADDLKKEKIHGITLLERLLYELKYWKDIGEHLDKEGTTLCAGSRDSDGLVPRAYWRDGQFNVNWSGPQGYDSSLRTRVVISC